jgi:hypothetical protein
MASTIPSPARAARWASSSCAFEDGIVIHHRPSTCASIASASGSQNVMSMALYSSMAVESSA